MLTQPSHLCLIECSRSVKLEDIDEAQCTIYTHICNGRQACPPSEWVRSDRSLPVFNSLVHCQFRQYTGVTVTHNYVDILQNMTNEQWPSESYYNDRENGGHCTDSFCFCFELAV